MASFKLPLKVLVIYGTGCFGWSISLNLISVLLNYIYLPPTNSGMKDLIPDVAWLGFISIISVILFSGRIVDLIIDPFVAYLTDRSQTKIGRRVPFMRIAFIPLSVFCTLIFFPIYRGQHTFNIYWLAGTQLLFYFFYTMYTIPYNALLADMGKDDKTKLNLSTAQSVGFMLGVICASCCTPVVKLLVESGLTKDRLTAYQFSVVGLNILGLISLAVPAFFLDEKKYTQKTQRPEGLLDSLKITLDNHNFRIYALAEAAYYMSIALISAGLLYYLKSMLKLEESVGALFMLGLVAITIIFYIPVNWLGTKFSKKKMIIISFAASAGVFFEIFFLGRFPLSPFLQAAILVVTYSIPNAFLQILPNTVLADISHENSKSKKKNIEGMFFGMRALVQKLGQTAGVTVFAMLIIWGKDPGHDLGLRLSGIAGSVLSIIATIAYCMYDEHPEK